MNETEILRRFPRASSAFVRNNLETGSKVPDSQPQPDKTPALGAAVQGEEKSVLRLTVCFTLFRVQLLDPDNAAGSCKDLLDGLRHAGILSDDTWYQIKLEVDQQRVDHYNEEKTVIEIHK